MTRRILHVSAAARSGGAARAAQRLHLAERAAGMDSRMLVAQPAEADPHVHMPLRGGARFGHLARQTIASRLAARQVTPGNPVLHSLARFSSGLGRWIGAQEVDIVNLHWIAAETLSIAEIGAIRQPVVWTMHDMWPFSGAEHYEDPAHPGRWREGYGASNRPAGDRGPDLDRRVWEKKRRVWAGRRFHLVSPSNWLADCARQSALFAGQPCHVIPNPIDTAVFRPIDRRLARGLLNLDPERRYVLFGAMSSTSDPRKGFAHLLPALHRLAADPALAQDTELLVFGASPPENPPDLGLPAHYLGSFHDDLTLALLYSAADVFAAPSVQDNLPNTLVEASACGTPSVAFAIGGMPDLILPGQTGHLARAFDPEDFARALSRTLTDPPPRAPIRDFALARFAPEVVAARYAALYEDILSGS